MGVRNCQELGINLQKICTRLMSNDELLKLLYYEDQDPLNKPTLSEEQKKTIFGNLITVIPKTNSRNDSCSAIALYIPKASQLSGNKEFKHVIVAIDVWVPLTQWIIKDNNLRPFAIMGEIQNSLNNKTVNGLGKISGGDFDLVALTEEMSIYKQTYIITEYD